MSSQKGAIPLLLLIAGVGLITILGLASIAPFRNSLLSTLFPKQFGFAANNEMGTAIGQLNLTPSFNSIGIETIFTGDTNNNSKVEVEFKKSSDTSWRKGLDLWKTDDNLFRHVSNFWQFNATGSNLVDTYGGAAATANGTTSIDLMHKGITNNKMRVLNGNSDFIEVSDPAAANFGSKVFSASIWIKTAQTTGVQTLLSKGGLDGPGYYLGLAADGKIRGVVSDGTNKIDITCSAGSRNLRNDAFHLISMVLVRPTDQGANKASLRIFADNTIYCDQPIDNLGSIDSTQPLRIGASPAGEYFKGTLDEVLILSNSMTQTAHQYMFNGPVATSVVGLPNAFQTFYKTGEKAFYGSTLLLDPGTDYELKLTVTDPDGGSQVINKTVKTRTDNIPNAATLVPTHFVRIDGSDSNNGTSAGSAWQTIEKAFSSAPSGAIVEVGPGNFTRPATSRTQPITLKAQYPAVDNNQQVINPGQHSIIDPTIITGPANSSAPHKNVWEEVTVGPSPIYKRNYTLWRWVGSPVSTNFQSIAAGYSASPAEIPLKLMTWRDGAANPNYLPAANPTQPEDIAERMYENADYNYGIAQDINNHLYLRLPPNAHKPDGTPTQNPNDIYIMIANVGHKCFNLQGPDIRITGFEARIGPECIYMNQLAQRNIIDHNLIIGGKGIVMQGVAGATSTYGKDHLIEHNRLVDYNLWSDNWLNYTNSNDPNVPSWNFVKQWIKKPNPLQKISVTAGTPTSGTFVLRYLFNSSIVENTSPLPYNATASQVQAALEANSLIGTGNVKVTGGPLPAAPFEVELVGKFAKYTHSSAGLPPELIQVLNNTTGATIAVTDQTRWSANAIGTDNQNSAIQNWGGANNVVIRNNYIDGYFNGVAAYSAGYDRYSTYNYDIYNNYIANIGDDAVEPETNAINWRVWNNTIRQSLSALSMGPASYGPIYYFKNSIWNINKSNFKHNANYYFATPIAYVINNTFINTREGVSGLSPDAGQQSYFPSLGHFYLRNNILRVSRYIYDMGGKFLPWESSQWNEDYNYFATINPAYGLRYNGVIYGTDVAGYRSVSGDGAHTNTLGNFHNYSVIDNNLNNINTGDLGLKANSGFIDAGTVVPNISDCFAGIAPDLGANEIGQISNCTTPQASPSPSSTASTSPAKPGDFDNNDIVDIFDYNQLLGDFGKIQQNLISDIDQNGTVDIFDYNTVLTNFGK